MLVNRCRYDRFAAVLMGFVLDVVVVFVFGFVAVVVGGGGGVFCLFVCLFVCLLLLLLFVICLFGLVYF